MSFPRISVVLPFRNAATTIGETLATVREQSFGEFECILIDNDSRDASASLAEQLCLHDPRFRIVRQSGGLIDALNAGLAAARAPYVARMDADDRAHPDRLAKQLSLLEADPSLSIASTLVSTFPATHDSNGMQRYTVWLNSLCTPEEIRNALFVESPIVHPTAMIRRDVLVAAGGYYMVDGPEDYDLWMRLLLRGHRAAKVREVLLHWRDSPQRLTRTDPRYSQERLLETKWRYFPEAVPVGTPLQICGAGRTGKLWARALRDRYPIRRFVDVDPHKQGRSLLSVPIQAPKDLRRGDGFVLAAVGTPGAREQIEKYLSRLGLQPWSEYLAVA